EHTPYGQRTVYFSPGGNDPTCHAATVMSRRVTASGTQQPYGLNPIGHQGLMHDEVTGVVYNRYRMWLPRVGRFAQGDPIGYPDGMNRFGGYHIMHDGGDPFGLGFWDWIYGTNSALIEEQERRTAANARKAAAEARVRGDQRVARRAQQIERKALRQAETVAT